MKRLSATFLLMAIYCLTLLNCSSSDDDSKHPGNTLFGLETAVSSSEWEVRAEIESPGQNMQVGELIAAEIGKPHEVSAANQRSVFFEIRTPDGLFIRLEGWFLFWPNSKTGVRNGDVLYFSSNETLKGKWTSSKQDVAPFRAYLTPGLHEASATTITFLVMQKDVTEEVKIKS